MSVHLALPLTPYPLAQISISETGAEESLGGHFGPRWNGDGGEEGVRVNFNYLSSQGCWPKP